LISLYEDNKYSMGNHIQISTYSFYTSVLKIDTGLWVDLFVKKQTSASLSKSKYRFFESLLPTSLDECDSTGAPYAKQAKHVD